MDEKALQYDFGKNWEKFLESMTEEQVLIAQDSLLASLRLDKLDGLSFLDIGCGSGIHSLCAWKSGAKKVLSFDYDIDSVNASRSLWEKAGSPDNWVIIHGSVLDRTFMESLDTFDIVYSWGVLHHTGNVWQAIQYARIPLAESGVFFLALYSYPKYNILAICGNNPSPEMWLEIKKSYNQAKSIKKKYIELQYIWRIFFRNAFPYPIRSGKAIKNFIQYIFEYKKKRGMNFMTDVRDWLGGWPMEFVKETDCRAFCEQKLNLELLDMKTGQGNTEYIFRPLGCHNYWDGIISRRQIVELPGPYIHQRGLMWKALLPDKIDIGAGRITLLEDGIPMSFQGERILHALYLFGEGLYERRDGTILFSTSDRSNPNLNDKKYSLFIE